MFGPEDASLYSAVSFVSSILAKYGYHLEVDQPFSLVRFYSENKLAERIDAALIVLICFLVVYAPLPFGSVQAGSMMTIQIVSAVCFLLWLYKLLFAGTPEQLATFREMHAAEKAERMERPLFHRHLWLTRMLRLLTLGRWPKRNRATNLVEDTDEDSTTRRHTFYSLFGYPVRKTGIESVAIVFLGLLCVQLIPLPKMLVAALSPATHDLYATAAAGADTNFYFCPLSLDPFATFTKLLEYSSYLVLYLVVVNNMRTRRLYYILLYTIFFAAVFQGVYGLYEFLSGHQHIFAYEKLVSIDSASGTFINRNHFAAYLEMSLPLLIALVAGRVSLLRSFRGSFFVRIAHALETEGSQVLLLILMIVLVAVSLVFSLSRSGISFAIVSLMTFFFIYLRGRQKLNRKTYLALGIGGTAALAVWIGLNPVLQRFLHLPENWAEGARLQVWSDTVDIFLHYPLAGTGAGTFDQIYPMYRSFVYHVIFQQAHNDYLQFLSECGLLFLFLVIALFDILGSRLKQITSREFTRLTVIQVGAFCSLLSLALHSITDFSFQIPAIALQGAIVAGLYFSHYHAENKRRP